MNLPNKTIYTGEQIWDMASFIQDPKTFHLLEKNPEKINWDYLCMGLKKISLPLLLKNPEKINWNLFSFSEISLPLFELYQEKLVRWAISISSFGFHLLQKYPEKIEWWALSANPSIFMAITNYKFLKKRMDIIREELVMKCMHPSRLERWIEMGGDIDDF